VFFWLFRSSDKGFKHYKSLIGVDDTHLYERYDEKLLIAVAFDANKQCRCK
jgi:hypothetical protein